MKYNERKLKKELTREADSMLKAKKEELTAFYQPTKQVQTRAPRVRRLVPAVVCAVLVVAVLLAVPALQNFEPSETPAESSMAAPSEGESEGDEWWNESGGENTHGAHGPSLLTSMYSKRVAIVEITEIDEDAIVNTPLATFSKLGCKVLYYHRTAYPLDTVDFILMYEEEAKKLSVGDKIFFVVMPINYENKTGYGPTVNSDDITEYLIFSDDKLLFEEDMLLNKSFQTIYHFNSMSRNCHEWYVLNGLEEHKVYNIRNLFRSGMTVEEIQAYFEEIDRLYFEVNEINPK